MNPIYIIWELIDDLICDLERICRSVVRSPVPYLGFGFGAVIVTWLLLGRTAEGDFLTVAFWSADPEGMRNLLWSLATVAAGAAGLYGLSLAARRTKALDEQARIAEETRKLSEQSQITERFTRAVEQLGNEKLSVRLGAVYALERIAKDSGRDLEAISSMLAAFIRDHSSVSDELNMTIPTGPELDVVAALTVLIRILDKKHEIRVSGKIDLQRVDFGGLVLPEADFSWFRLDSSNFDYSSMDKADFSNTSANSASFRNATLRGFLATGAEMNMAYFADARLEGAHFEEAFLQTADFSRADLAFSKFHGARLVRTRFNSSELLRTNFAVANLQGATFFGSGCLETNFESANLSGADFSEAKLNNVSFENAKLDGAKHISPHPPSP
ncbi:secreted effector protein PipB2 [Rhodobiaceae bacterium]|nr:secreted effector protein PipB2 [Rhodobiaceae bacterium]